MALFLLFFSISTHAMELDQILFQKHSPSTTVHYELKGAKGEDKSVVLDGGSNELNKRYNPPLKLRVVHFDISMDASRNLPAGKALKASLSGKIIIQGDYKYKVKMKPVILGGEKYKHKKLNCDELFYVSPHMGRLIIEIKDEFGLSSCTLKDVPNIDPTQIGKRDLGGDHGNYYTNNQDTVLGRDASRQFMDQNKDIMLSKGHPTSVYTQGLMNQIASASDNPEITPNVHVVNANIMNAFALPGGEVFVFRGLIDQSQNEAQLAGVLGHEWAHVTMRHGTRGMSRSLKVMLGAQTGSILIGIFAGTSKNQTVRDLAPLMQLAVLKGGELAIMGFSRSYERDADKIGAQYAWNAGYSPSGIGQMFEVFSSVDPSHSNYNFLQSAFNFNSHPDNQERISRNYLYSGFCFPTNSNVVMTSAAYESAKHALISVPPTSDYRAKEVMNGFKNALTSVGHSSIEEKFRSMTE